MKRILYNKQFLQLISLLGLILMCFPIFNSYGKYISIVIIICLMPALYQEFVIKRDFLKSIGGKFGILFLAFYIITICFSSKTDLISTLHGLVWTIINFLIIYAYNKNDDIVEKKKSLLFINTIIISLSTGISIISMILYFSLVSIPVDGWIVGINMGRNSGITIDPIQLSWIAFIAIGCAMINLCLKNKKNGYFYFLIASLIINFVCLETTITRNSVYTTIALLALVVATLAFCKCKGLFLRKFAIACVALFASIALLFCVDSVLKKTIPNVLSFIGNKQSEVVEESNDIVRPPKQSEDSDTKEAMTDNFTRTADQYGFKYGLSGRYEIWMCGLNVVKEYPLFGVSTGDMVHHTYELNKETEYMKVLVNPSVFISQHNGLMQVLVASGIVGLVFSSLMVLVGFYRVIKEYLFNLGSCLKEKELVAILFSIAFIMFFIMNIGQTVSFFMISFINCYFWYILHYLMYFFEQKEENKK